MVRKSNEELLKEIIDLEGKKQKKKRVTINRLRKLYKEALRNEEYGFIDMDITEAFWSLKKVRVAFEKLIGKDSAETMNYDVSVEGTFMDEILSGKKEV